MALVSWNVDPSHSAVRFSVRHMMFATVHGRFAKFELKLDIDDADPSQSKISAKIDAASVDTNEPTRDNHIRSADFFDIEKTPHITFESRAIQKAQGAHYRMTGALTMRGVTHDVTVDVELLGRGKDPWGNDRAGFVGKLSVDREKWGLKWNQALEAGGLLVSDRVDIELDIQATAPKPA